MSGGGNLDLIAQIADVAGVVLWGGTEKSADFFNRHWVAITGEPTDSTTPWEETIHPDDRLRCRIAWSETLQHRAIGDVEARLRDRDGKYLWFVVRFVASEDRWFAIAKDLGLERRDEYDTPARGYARERARRGDAEQANRLKDRLLAAVSHELRAPIAAVLLWERLLREDSSDPETRKRALDAIHHSAVLQARLVDDLLDVARANAGKLTVRLRPVTLKPILERVVDAVRPLAASKRLQLEVDIHAEIGRVHGDAARLAQVVENLLANAIKFTPEGGHIKLEARTVDDHIVIDVTDNGRGIAPEFLPHVFEAFSQTADLTTRNESGLGLGLAIANELVALHSGSIEASSDGPGLGARFCVKLPITHRRALSEDLDRPMAKLTDVSVLLIDDDSRVLGALQLLLDRAGAQIRCASSVADAWTMLESAPPDVVVSDIAMPVEDGYDFVRRLRNGPLSHLPAIALTAHASTADADRALAAGFDVHIAKPIDFEILVSTISRLVGRDA